MKKIIFYLTFIASSFAIVWLFITSTTYIQLAVATLLYPPLAYFAFVIFPRNSRKKVVIQQAPTVAATQVVTNQTVEPDSGNSGILDENKRDFLKMIGAAGISFFLYSIFARGSGPLFFGKSEDSASQKDGSGKISPAPSPTDGYQISEIDDSYVSYYGFTNHDGGWFIMKEDTDSGSFRYAKGSADFSGNWSSRENLEYDYYHNVF